MSFFGVPLSGLIAAQDQLQSVSNNLANLDTTGYKDQTASFSDLFAQSSLLNGANNPVQTGLGVTASQTDTNFTDGTPSATGIASNMALSGNGFFVTKSPSGSVAYTRAGDFTTNSSGQLIASDGSLVQGYGAVNGVVSANGALQPLNVGTGTVIPASATTTFNLAANLSSAAAVGDTYSSTTPVYDSLGSSHVLTVDYTKTGTNTWSYSVNLPTADTGATTTQVANGTLTFDTSGKLTSPTGNVAVNIPGFADGAASMNLNWNLDDSTGSPSITQTALASGTSGTTQDGTASATLSSYNIGTDGTIDGTFSNGKTMALGQVAVATFANTQGLLRIGSNNYQVTAGSGSANIGAAGSGGRGTITGGSVEGSNVDVAAEFAKMITAQQAYQSNAKTVTTLQAISQATLQMVQ
jgi:flagellar hook protein FlgE